MIRKPEILEPTERAVTHAALESSLLALAEAQSTLAAVLENTNNGIFFVAPDLTILYVNRRMGELFGIDLRGTIGRRKTDVINERIMCQMEHPEEFLERLRYLYRHTEETAVDEVVVARPTRRVLERYSAPVYKDDGALQGRIEVYSDVTEVRELQRNKDEFLSLVSHELRTPVTSIKGYAQLLRRRARQHPVSDQTAVAYETIDRQATRMQELIDSLLDLSRLESGRLHLQVSELDFSDVATRTAEMVQMTTDDHAITLSVPAGPLWMVGDERRLEQVMTNLLTNAVRYSPNGGPITVALSKSDGTITALITDRGMGIAPDAIDHIFERFYRAQGVAESSGLGIGLYLTKRIVERHEGSITVDSRIGGGSTFIVTLPVQPSNVSAEDEMVRTP